MQPTDVGGGDVIYGVGFLALWVIGYLLWQASVFLYRLVRPEPPMGPLPDDLAEQWIAAAPSFPSAAEDHA